MGLYRQESSGQEEQREDTSALPRYSLSIFNNRRTSLHVSSGHSTTLNQISTTTSRYEEGGNDDRRELRALGDVVPSLVSSLLPQILAR